MHYYSFNVDDYQLATLHLSNEEDLCYRRLLDLYYQTERPLQNDLKFLSKKIRMKEAVILSVLNEFFFCYENVWKNNRADLEIKKLYEKSAKARESVDKRWNKQKYERDTNVLRTNYVGNTNLINCINSNYVSKDTKEISSETKVSSDTKKSKILAEKPESVPAHIWDDYMTLRKAKKLPFTQSALNMMIKSATASNISILEAILICINFSWAGFTSEYYRNSKQKIDSFLFDMRNKQEIVE